MTKRVDRRTGGLLPELERPEGKRAIVRSDNKPWCQIEEAVMVAAVAACQSKSHYELIAPRLMRAIGHAPTYEKGKRVPIRAHTDNCIRALELRLISKMLNKEYAASIYNNPFMGFHRSILPQATPLTWGERVKIITPWVKKSGKHIDIAALFHILGRGTGDEYTKKYLWVWTPRMKEKENLDARQPIPEGQELFLMGIVSRLRDEEMMGLRTNHNFKFCYTILDFLGID